MNVNKFNLFASTLGYTKTEAQHLKNVYTTTHNGFPVSLSLGMPALANVANGLPVLTFYFADDANEKTIEYNSKNIKKLLASALKEEKVKVHPIKNQFHFILRVTKKEEANTYMERVFSIIDTVFKEQGIQPLYTCPTCGQGNCDAMYFNQSMLTPIHSGCKSTLIEQTTQTYKDKQQNSKFFRGLIGLLIGGFIGGIPSILSILLFNYELLYLYALIPLGSLFAYKLLGGEAGVIPTILITIWSFIQVFVVSVLSLYFRHEQWFSISDIIDIITSDMGFFLEQTWFGYISVALGLIPTVIEGLNTANKKSKMLLKSINNMQVYIPNNNVDGETNISQTQEVKKDITHVEPEIL